MNIKKTPWKLLAISSILLMSCEKDYPRPTVSGPDINDNTYIDPIIRPPSECGGWWICLTQNIFTSVTYTASTLNGNPLFMGAFGAATASEDKLYFGGGHEEGYIGFEQAEVIIRNLNSGSWDLRYLSIPRSHLTAVHVNGRVIFAGGNNWYTCCPVYGINLKYYGAVDIFDNTTLNQTTAILSEARSDLASVSTSGKAYFIGGKTMDGFSSRMDIYDAGRDSWRHLEMPRQRGYAGAAVVGNRIYISGGMNEKGNITTTDVFDVTTETWSEIQTPHEHPFASSLALKGKVFVCGGDGLSNKSVDIFDTQKNTWSSYKLSDSRYNISVTSSGGKIIFFGGNFSARVDMYNSQTDTWSSTSLWDGVDGVSAASTPNGSYFTGLLYQKGNAISNTVMIVVP